jgi:subtilisin family serine protease
MKKIYIILMIILPVITKAQLNNSRISIDLLRLYNDSADKGNYTVPLLIKGNINVIKNLTNSAKGKFKYSVSDIASVNIPLNTIGTFLENPAIKRLEYRAVKTTELFYEDSTADVNNRIRPVHNGEGILPYGFRGESVVLGIIDDGFEWRHPDLVNNDSTSRIRYLWDQAHVNPNFFEDFYAYGSSWNKAQIDSGLITHNPNIHGSHVLGTAAGNARAANKYIGIAPESEIVAVAIDENSGNFLGTFVDGVHYIFAKADELQLPCAINSSVGTYYGSHDGRDLYSALLDSMLSEKGGRALIQAAGNARQFKIHWQATNNTMSDTSRVWFKPVPAEQKTMSYIYADTADFNNLNFSFEWIDSTNFSEKGSTRTFNILRDFNLSSAQPATIRDTLFYINGQMVLLTMYVEQWAGAYELYFEISNSQNTRDYWQLTLSGQGKADIWSHQQLMGISSMLMNGNAAAYKNPDSIQTIVGYWTCSENVITVGSYQNMAWLENYSGDTVALFTAGALPPCISHFSSLGPTRDNRQKPDLTAPGGQVMSAATLTSLNSYQNNNFPYLDKEGWHIAARGTSMAAPMVAGAAALYFQCRPNATCLNLKNALSNSARIDSCVFMQNQQLPNKQWGYGKLDVYNLISACMIYGCTDSNAINFNPSAHIDDGSCLIISSSDNINDTEWDFYPNPFRDKIQLRLRGDDFQKITVFSINGAKIYEIIADGQNIFEIGGELSAGTYIIQLQNNSGIKSKLLIKI